MAIAPPPRRPVKLATLRRRAGREAADAWADPALAVPVDRSRRYTADAVCPLAHHAVWETFDDAQRLRCNQLVGLFQNEMIVFFETRVAGAVLPALLADRGVPEDLSAAVRGFLDEEREHTKHFRALNRSAEPGWYDAEDFHVLRLPGPLLRLQRAVGRRPAWFPFLFWVMLLMEERSLLLSRHVVTQPGVDPRFAAVYRAHRIDEARHVQTDWHLLERFWLGRPRALRAANAQLLRATLVGLFLKPRRANVRLIDLLIADVPRLAPRRAELVAAVRGLDGNAGYRRMMYSEEATPIACRLFRELPELRSLGKRVLA